MRYPVLVSQRTGRVVFLFRRDVEFELLTITETIANNTTCLKPGTSPSVTNMTDHAGWKGYAVRNIRTVDYASQFPTAAAVLLDAFVEGYGGGGKTFDWSLISRDLPMQMILSGGLSPENVYDAVRAVRPCAVDVSSGVELAKGIKDRAKIEAFVSGVRNADE